MGTVLNIEREPGDEVRKRGFKDKEATIFITALPSRGKPNEDTIISAIKEMDSFSIDRDRLPSEIAHLIDLQQLTWLLQLTNFFFAQ